MEVQATRRSTNATGDLAHPRRERQAALSATDLPMPDVELKSGFANASKLSAAFRTETAQTRATSAGGSASLRSRLRPEGSKPRGGGEGCGPVVRSCDSIALSLSTGSNWA